MMSSVARVKFIKTKAIFSYHTQGVSNQVSSNSDHKIISYSCSNSSTKMGKNEKVGRNFLGYKTGEKGDYKLGQVLRITDLGNRGYKQVQFQRFQIEVKRLQLGVEFQIGAMRFHIGAEITNWCRTNEPLNIRVMSYLIKQIMHVLFCWISNSFTLGEMMFNSTARL